MFSVGHSEARGSAEKSGVGMASLTMSCNVNRQSGVSFPLKDSARVSQYDSGITAEKERLNMKSNGIRNEQERKIED
jgi:hypothetical protein